MEETEGLVTALRERGRRHGHALRQELVAIQAAAEAEGPPATRPPIQLTTVRTTTTATWSRAEI
jgi:hypothetical protein